MSIESRNDYRELKGDVRIFADEFIQLSESINTEEQHKKVLGAIRAKLDSLENNEFIVVVIGEMKHGKSTFLNAMLGKPAFPRDVREATAAVTFLRHNDTIRDVHPDWVDKAVVKYTDGSPLQVVDHLSLEKYTTCLHRDELNVAENVEEVTIYCDSPFVRDGVTVVDTPGTNTTNSRHEDITYTQISKSHAAIFLFKAGEAGKNSDFTFLSDTANAINKFFFIANRVDEIGGIGPKSDEVIEDIKRKVRDNSRLNDIITNSRFFPTSGLLALQARWDEYVCDNSNLMSRDSWENEYKGNADKLEELEKRAGMKVFESELQDYLFKGPRVQDMFKNNLKAFQQGLEDMRRQIDERMEVLDNDMSLAELENKRELVESRKKEREAQLAGLGNDLVTQLNTAMRDFNESAANAAANRLSEFNEVLSQYTSYQRLARNWDSLIGEIRKSISGYMRRTSEELRETVEDVFRTVDTSIRSKLYEDMESSAILNFPEIPEINIGLSFSSMPELEEDKKYRELEDKVSELEKQVAASVNDRAELELAQERLKHVQAEKQEMLEEFQYKRQILGTRPDKQYVVDREEHDEKEWRGGLIGWILTPFIGKKTVHYPEEGHYDDRAQREYDDNVQKLNQLSEEKKGEIDKKIREQYSNLEEKQRKVMQSALYEKLHQAEQKKLADYKHKYEEQKNRQDEAALEDNKAKLSQLMKEELDSYLDNLKENASSCRVWADRHIADIQSSMDATVEARKKELDQLEKDISATATEKEAKKKKLEEIRDRHNHLNEEYQKLDIKITQYSF